MNPRILKEFLEAVWRKGQLDGYPVDMWQIGKSMFGEDINAMRQSTINVVEACRKARYIIVTDSHNLRFEERGKRFIGKE